MSGRPPAAGPAIADPVARIASLSVVVPEYVERESLQPLVAELLPTLRGLGIAAECSSWTTARARAARRCSPTWPPRSPRSPWCAYDANFGKGVALMAGFREAAGDAIVTIDGDLRTMRAPIWLTGVL